MARRKRAPARRGRASNTMRRARKPARGSRLPAHRTYTPELLANGRQRYEQTPEPVAAIAADFRIHPGSLRRLAYRLGWVRYNMGPRELPLASRILSQAEELETQAASPPPPERGRSPSQRVRAKRGPMTGSARRVGVDANTSTTPTLTLPLSGGGNANAEITVPLADTIDRLEQAVLEELATVEAMRARLKGLPRRPRDAETTARTISSLTETLQKLQRLRCALPPSGSSDDDDMPADIDEFRHELARRIRAFIASRTDRSDAGGDAARPVAEVR